LEIGSSLNEVLNEEISILLIYKDSIKPRCVCNPSHFLKNLKKGSFYCPFFLIKCYKIIMSKRYSGKSFKDSSVSKKPKLSLKEKRKKKTEKRKK
jgi:hypothetical protein